MLSQTLLVALAGVASASMIVPAQNARRAVEARQTSAADASACLAALGSLITDLPQPPAALTSYILTATIDYCDPQLAGSIGAVFTSYESAVSSWYSAHSSQWSAAHRETGFAGAAVALAGFLAVVALL